MHANEKNKARENIYEFCSSTDFIERNKRKVVIVRANCPYTTPYGKDDLAMLNNITSNIDAILIPKVSEQQQIERLFTENLVNKAVPIWAMIETAKGIINVNQIASSPLIEALVFGSNDLTKDIKALHTAYR